MNRTLCAVLDTMRKLTDKLQKADWDYDLAQAYTHAMAFYIEEAQGMGDRMEASLYDKHDYKRIQDKIKEAKKELNSLKAEIKELKPRENESYDVLSARVAQIFGESDD